MSGFGEDASNDKPPRRILEIDLHGSPQVKAAEEARLLAQKHEDLVREMEKHSGAWSLREQLGQIERGSVLAHAREVGIRLFEEDSAMRTVRERFQEFEQTTVLAHARFLDENSAITHALRSQEELARTALGPMWELRQAGLFAEDAPWQRTAALAREAMTKYEARFRLPDQLESGLLAEQFRSSIAENLAIHYQVRADETLQRAMEKMQVPWLDQQQVMRSVAGLPRYNASARRCERCQPSTTPWRPSCERALATGATRFTGDQRSSPIWPRERTSTWDWASIPP